MKRYIAVLACNIMLLSPLHATDIYRWVDESGRTQLSDVVPEKYKNSATHVNSRQFELSPEQVGEAEARAAQEKARAAEAVQRQVIPSVDHGANAASAAAAPKTAPKPPEPVGEDCASLYRQYWKSQDCFAPYRNANGSMKAVAFEICGAPVQSPVLKCGPPKAE